ncbi:hypothetical protein L208DRAFT_1414402 [Tricholoma matsutake]|nr:hypothetical protein L208DRAFT_1414402 [Tricholoma matsutake 945]
MEGAHTVGLACNHAAYKRPGRIFMVVKRVQYAPLLNIYTYDLVSQAQKHIM